MGEEPTPDPVTEHLAETMQAIAVTMGRLDEKLTSLKDSVGDQLGFHERRALDHESRILALERAQVARDAAEVATEKAIAETMADEDRYGQRSPRALLLAIVGTVGTLATLLIPLLNGGPH